MDQTISEEFQFGELYRRPFLIYIPAERWKMTAVLI